MQCTHIPHPWLCFLRHWGMCCQSNSYLRAGEWKQHNAQYAERLAPVKWQSQCVHMALRLCWEMHEQTLPREKYPLSSLIPEGQWRRLGLNSGDMIDGQSHNGTNKKCLEDSLLRLYIVFMLFGQIMCPILCNASLNFQPRVIFYCPHQNGPK